MKKVKYGKSATRNDFNTKEVLLKKQCKMKKAQHGKSATRNGINIKKCNMK